MTTATTDSRSPVYQSLESQDHLWLDLDTGRIVPDEEIDQDSIPDNFCRIDRADVSIPGEVLNAIDDGDNLAWLEWFGKRKLLLKYELDLLKTQHRRRLTRVQYLLDDHEAMVPYARELAEIECRKGKGKHVDLPSCRIGFRRTPPKSEIIDMDAAVEWCGEHCPAAVRVETSILKKQLPDKGRDVPGIAVTTENKLFVKGM